MKQYLEQALDDLDATVFTEDFLHNNESREAFKESAERWLRVIKAHIKLIVKTITCNYCGYIKVIADQDGEHPVSWAKLKIKNNFSGDSNRGEITYFETNMCPDCIAKKCLTKGAG